jgi:hypothetical protein
MPRSPVRLYYDVLERRNVVRVYAIWHTVMFEAIAAE